MFHNFHPAVYMTPGVCRKALQWRSEHGLMSRGRGCIQTHSMSLPLRSWCSDGVWRGQVTTRMSRSTAKYLLYMLYTAHCLLHRQQMQHASTPTCTHHQVYANYQQSPRTIINHEPGQNHAFIGHISFILHQHPSCIPRCAAAESAPVSLVATTHRYLKALQPTSLLMPVRAVLC